MAGRSTVGDAGQNPNGGKDLEHSYQLRALLQSQAFKWLDSLLDLSDEKSGILKRKLKAKDVRSGELLCRAVQELHRRVPEVAAEPVEIRETSNGASVFRAGENIQSFQQFAVDIGVPEILVIDTNELTQRKGRYLPKAFLLQILGVARIMSEDHGVEPPDIIRLEFDVKQQRSKSTARHTLSEENLTRLQAEADARTEAHRNAQYIDDNIERDVQHLSIFCGLPHAPIRVSEGEYFFPQLQRARGRKRMHYLRTIEFQTLVYVVETSSWELLSAFMSSLPDAKQPVSQQAPVVEEEDNEEKEDAADPFAFDPEEEPPPPSGPPPRHTDTCESDYFPSPHVIRASVRKSDPSPVNTGGSGPEQQVREIDDVDAVDEALGDHWAEDHESPVDLERNLGLGFFTEEHEEQGSAHDSASESSLDSEDEPEISVADEKDRIRAKVQARIQERSRDKRKEFNRQLQAKIAASGGKATLSVAASSIKGGTLKSQGAGEVKSTTMGMQTMKMGIAAGNQIDDVDEDSTTDSSSDKSETENEEAEDSYEEDPDEPDPDVVYKPSSGISHAKASEAPKKQRRRPNFMSNWISNSLKLKTGGSNDTSPTSDADNSATGARERSSAPSSPRGRKAKQRPSGAATMDDVGEDIKGNFAELLGKVRSGAGSSRKILVKHNSHEEQHRSLPDKPKKKRLEKSKGQGSKGVTKVKKTEKQESRTGEKRTVRQERRTKEIAKKHSHSKERSTGAKVSSKRRPSKPTVERRPPSEKVTSSKVSKAAPNHAVATTSQRFANGNDDVATNKESKTVTTGTKTMDDNAHVPDNPAASATEETRQTNETNESSTGRQSGSHSPLALIVGAYEPTDGDTPRDHQSGVASTVAVVANGPDDEADSEAIALKNISTESAPPPPALSSKRSPTTRADPIAHPKATPLPPTPVIPTTNTHTRSSTEHSSKTSGGGWWSCCAGDDGT